MDGEPERDNEYLSMTGTQRHRYSASITHSGRFRNCFPQGDFRRKQKRHRRECSAACDPFDPQPDQHTPEERQNGRYQGQCQVRHASALRVDGGAGTLILTRPRLGCVTATRHRTNPRSPTGLIV
jgi:hypothetical protein